MSLLHAVYRLASVPPGLRYRDGDDADDDVDDASEIRPTSKAAQWSRYFVPVASLRSISSSVQYAHQSLSLVLKQIV